MGINEGEKGMTSDVFVLERERVEVRKFGSGRCYFWHMHSDAKLTLQESRIIAHTS